MNLDRIAAALRGWLENREISCGGLLIRRGDEVMMEQNLGDAEPGRPAASDSLYRMMSMTKPVAAVAVMQQIEDGRFTLDTPVSRFLPSFAHPRAAAEGENVSAEFFSPEAVKTVPARRDITVRDLLTHSSGLAQGPVGLGCYSRDPTERRTLADAVEGYSRYILDFQPGTASGYSAMAGFDVLLRVCELAADEDAPSLLRRRIFAPLGMADTGFFPGEEQRSRLVRLAERKNGVLEDVTGTGGDILTSSLKPGTRYAMGGAGLCSTLGDYDRFVHMLLNGGDLDGERILAPETVLAMRRERMERPTDTGAVWGLGMMVREDPAKAGSPCTAGAYGWSGAYGTHFVVSPRDNLSFVWVTNRTDLNGSGSYISFRLEELVFGKDS